MAITSDHGFFMGDHGWFDKRFMYEHAIRVPWMIRYPGVAKPGSTSEAMAVNIDNAPTILDLAGLPVPADMQGVSLLPHIEGKPPQAWRDSCTTIITSSGRPTGWRLITESAMTGIN